MDLGRIITAMISPMAKDGSLDYQGAQTLAEHLLDHGSDSLVVTGTTGESPTLSFAEKLKMYSAVHEVCAARRKMLIAGTSGNNTAEAVELSKKAESLGADAILAVVPPYNKPTQEGLYQHFNAIAHAVSLPVILYNVPSRTVVNLEPETVARLSQTENIIAIKEASPNMDEVSQLRCLLPDSFKIYAGDDSLLLPMMALGACGVVSVASHFIGTQLQKMIDFFEQGKIADAAAIHKKYFSLFRALFVRTNPVPTKYALEKMGLPAGPCRLPLVELDDGPRTVVDNALKNAALI